MKPSKELELMLRYKRPASSWTEESFIEDWLLPLPGIQVDAVGNLYLGIGDSPILWSAHTDTVHRTPGFQTLRWERGCLSAVDSNCLGADDTTGCWMLRQMVLRGIPGLYVWHRGEEIGGRGSSYIAQETPELLEGIRYAVAFDRRGYDSVVESQFGPCCSFEFAGELRRQLGFYDNPADAIGLFTDTANYTQLIPECSNISVGYFDAHSPQERQDVGFALDLLERVSKLDIDRLPTVRDNRFSKFTDAFSHDADFFYCPFCDEVGEHWDSVCESCGQLNMWADVQRSTA